MLVIVVGLALLLGVSFIVYGKIEQEHRNSAQAQPQQQSPPQEPRSHQTRNRRRISNRLGMEDEVRLHQNMRGTRISPNNVLRPRRQQLYP